VGKLAKTIQSWSYGDIKLKESAPAGLPSGGAYAISVGAGYSTQLTMHGSLVFEYGDVLELRLQLYGAGAGNGAKLELMAGDSNTRVGQVVMLDPVPEGQWRSFTVPASMFFDGQAPLAQQQLNGLHVGINPADGDTDSAALLLADFELVAKLPLAEVATAIVGTSTGRKVSPRLFGVNFGDSNDNWQDAYTTNRWGGNAVTRYAWDVDIQNRAFDYFFEDIPNTVDDEAALPFNSSSDRFIAATLGHKALPVLTIPTIGWAPKADRSGKRCGFSVAKYGAQQQTDQYFTDCGNGVKASGGQVTGNDPTDTSRQVGPEYSVAWLDHLVEHFGDEVVRDGMLYILDNEPNYWSGTHRDVHPEPLGYDELWNYTVAYGEALQQAHPGVKLMGPDIAGFPDLFTRSCGADCQGHGSKPIIEWFIQQLGEYQQQTGTKLLEYLDIHCYPEGDSWNNGDAADVTMRMRGTRELWDESFFAETWHVMPLGLLRRTQKLIDQYAPWLKMSCTEFVYGADTDVVDAVLTLDALAVYAREGVDLATRWTVPTAGSVTAYAYRLLNNYDGHGGSLAGLSYVEVASSDALLGAHAFVSDDGSRQAVLLINRQYEGHMATTAKVDVATSSGKLFRLGAGHMSPSDAELVPVNGGEVVIDLPPVSAALLVFEVSGATVSV